MRTELKYIELKSGFSDNGNAWIALVSFSKSGKTVYFNGKAFQSLNGMGISGNYFDLESGDEYWVSGVKKDMSDRHQFGGGKILVEKRILSDYLQTIGRTELPKVGYELTEVDTEKPIERINELENSQVEKSLVDESIYTKTPKELTNGELEFLIEEKEKRYNELMVANKELTSQNVEKEKRIDELIIANKELAFQRKKIIEFVDIIQEKNNKLEALERAIDMFLVCSITDAEGTIISVNKKFSEISKYSQEELIGQNHRILNSDYHPKEFFKQLWETIGIGKIWYGEIRNKAKDGTFYWGETMIFPIHGKDGQVLQYISWRMPITKRKLLENQMLKHYEELEQFSYISAHDLKSPVLNLAALANMLEEADGLNEQGKIFFDKIKTSILQIQNTISKLNEVLALKKNISGQSANLSLNEELNEVLDSLEINIKKTKGKINYDFSEMPYIYFPKIQLHSIFQNLITNSLKYHKPNAPPIIDIQSKSINGAFCLIFKDNGQGIDLTLHKKNLFGLFKRFHDNFEGKGIGLYIVKSIVESNGGNIDVASKVNQGITFTIYLNANLKN